MAESSPNWLDLPQDITASILLRLGPVEILKTAQLVCSQWRSISKEPSLWTTVAFRTTDTRDRKDVLSWTEVVNLCWRAVDRSCGGLVELSIESFLTDELLRHITASCSGIKRLRLVSCYNTTNEGLSDAALPLLEDLELSFVWFSGEALEAISRISPSLKSLKVNGLAREYYIHADELAQIIAKTMPGLRHLQLVGNRLTDLGLEAILSGCPHLEDLDLRGCRRVDLTGEMGKRCAERIRNLRRPSDPTYDIEYLVHLLGDINYEYDSDAWHSDVFTDNDDNNDYYGSDSDYGGDLGGSLGDEGLGFY